MLGYSANNDEEYNFLMGAPSPKCYSPILPFLSRSSSSVFDSINHNFKNERKNETISHESESIAEIQIEKDMTKKFVEFFNFLSEKQQSGKKKLREENVLFVFEVVPTRLP